jgi:putrescine transport system ATP-binding protein
MAQPLLQFDCVTKRYGGFTAVDRLSLDISAREFFALLGPSGCGKSTLLRLVAGFETPDEGRVLLDGVDLAGTPPHLRPVNMMFQSYALFPHMSVESNIAFGLKQEGLAKGAIAQRVTEMLALVQLEQFAKRRPDQLSGGQKQRVALARALVKRPKVLLLDEPLAALDKKLRQETQFELMELQKRTGTTFVIVTHDQEEAMTVAHRLAVMDHGRIAQVGAPADVYEQPNSRYVANFIGDINLIEGCVASADPDGIRVQAIGGELIRVASGGDAKPGDTMWVALRPEKLSIATEQPADKSMNALAGTVAEIGYLGDLSVYNVRVSDRLTVKATVPNTTRMRARPINSGDRVWLTWPADVAVLLTR